MEADMNVVVLSVRQVSGPVILKGPPTLAELVGEKGRALMQQADELHNFRRTGEADLAARRALQRVLGSSGLPNPKSVSSRRSFVSGANIASGGP